MWAISEGESGSEVRGSFIFMGWVISKTNKWEDYSKYFGKTEGIFRSWATSHFEAFYGQTLNCWGYSGCVNLHMLIYHNECITRLKIQGKSNLLPSWA